MRIVLFLRLKSELNHVVWRQERRMKTTGTSSERMTQETPRWGFWLFVFPVMREIEDEPTIKKVVEHSSAADAQPQWNVRQIMTNVREIQANMPRSDTSQWHFLTCPFQVHPLLLSRLFFFFHPLPPSHRRCPLFSRGIILFSRCIA